MGFLDGIFGGGDTPSYNAPTMPAQNKGFIDSQISRGTNADSGQLAQEQMRGVKESASGFLNDNNINNRNIALGMGSNPALTQAISNKANNSFNDEINSLQQNNKLQAELQRSQLIDRSTRLANQQVQFGRTIQNRLRAAEQTQEASRNQVLASVLGVAGTVTGSILSKPAAAISPTQTAAQGRGFKGYFDDNGSDFGNLA